MNNKNEQDIREWMENVAKNKKPKKKLIFDKKTKRLIAVYPNDPRADDNIEFSSQEATRFY